MDRRFVALPLVAATFALGACGDKKKSSSESAAQPTTPATTPATTTATATTPAAKPSVAKKSGISTNLTQKPSIPKPTAPAPTQLEIHDIVGGSGAGAQAGEQISVQYVGVSYKTGKQFDASWDRGAQPFQFQLGAGMVIPGWDQGLVGMKPGGRRELIIPAALAYGAQGSPPSIGPNETLIFVVDRPAA
jgi:peptidylprolyl isomerase